MKYQALIMIGFLTVAPSLSHAQDVFKSKVTSGYSDASLVWGGSLGKGYDSRIRFIVDSKGNLALCGIGRVVNAQLFRPVNDALRGGYVSIKGKKVLKNFRYFAKARREAELSSGVANCKSTGVKPPRKSSDLNIQYGKASYRN